MIEISRYVAVSGQVSLQRRLDTIANNVANSSTTGYRVENVDFETVLSQTPQASVAFAAPADPNYSFATGPIKQTGNPLDIAVHGKAFLAIATDAGQVYTRDGRMQLTAEGVLQTVTGHSVLDVGGAPIRIDPNAGPIVISANGAIRQGNNLVGEIGLFEKPENAKIGRYGTSGFISDQPWQLAVDRTANRIIQGHLEGSNGNPVLDMTHLIEVTRSFQAISNTIDEAHRTMNDAIRTLAGSR